MRVMHTGKGTVRDDFSPHGYEFAHLLSPEARKSLAEFEERQAKKIAAEQAKRKGGKS